MASTARRAASTRARASAPNTTGRPRRATSSRSTSDMGRPSSTGDFACTRATLAGGNEDDEPPSDEPANRLSCRPSMRRISFTLVLVLAGCGASSEPVDIKTPGNSSDAKDTEPSGDAKQSPPAPSASTTPEGPGGPDFNCRLPAPVSSDDACTKDADCAPSVPCHARACVAVGKAEPRKPDTVCTMNIDCSSADVNPCSCYQGRCALVPKSP